ncbi:MAG: MerR family transcriptional regulator [Polyangiaceae bacterium]|jgi:DNA-binding transcriptional MerR regulator
MTAVARTPPVDRGEFPYRMKDLCDRTGLPRQAIHFYIQQGLLPEGEKTGKNMAYYGEAHLERLKLIRQLQHERFLPLRAIRAVLDEEDDGFTQPQRRFFLDVKHRLGPIAGSGEGDVLVPLHPLLLRAGVSREDADELARIGVLHLVKKKGRQHLAKEDAWMIELWGEIRATGFTKALGFVPQDVTLFAEALEAIFAKEREMLKDRVSHLPPAEVARMVESAIPLLNQFMARYHESLIRKFFASLQP